MDLRSNAHNKHYKGKMTFDKEKNVDGLVRRMTDGLGSNKYREVDYESIKSQISKKRFSSIKTSMKVAKIHQVSEQRKENNLIKQHQLIWQKEFNRLQHIRRKTQVELEGYMRSCRDSEFANQLIKDFDYYDANLSTEFNEFKTSTVDPVWSLRDDLRYWVTENREELSLGSPDVVAKHTEIRQTVEKVKKQQEEILEKLYYEQKSLEQELNSHLLIELCPPAIEKHASVIKGIPLEAIEVHCPNSVLKAEVLQEFLILDDKFERQIEELDYRHSLAKSCDNCGGWDPEEHFEFVAINEQYPKDFSNRRALVFDRLKRQLPEKSRTQLLDHEDWWLDYKYYFERLRGICNDWIRDKKELMCKAQMVFAEAAVAHELEEVKAEYHEKQKVLCEILFEQVRKWREKKDEASRIQDEINEERRKLFEESQAVEKEKERRKRDRDKRMIQKFNDVREERLRLKEEEAKEKLLILQKEMEEQAIFDKERIKFREQQLVEKLEEKKQKEEEKTKELQEQEERLEAIRQQVRIVAKIDPTRTKQPTKAWVAHHNTEDDEAIPITKNLFDVHGYSSSQITSDHRLRLEQKLREAGLHTSEYGRKMIRQAKPPQPPRKDILHTFKFTD